MAKYKTYHGRPRFRGLKIAVLLVLLAGIGSLVLFVLPNHISYDAEGNVTLDLPFLRRFMKPDPVEPDVSPTGSILVVDSPSPSPTTAPTLEPTPSPTQAPRAAGKLLFIPAARTKSIPALTDLKELALAEGYTGVVIEYKKEGASEGENDLTMTPETAAEVMDVFADSGLELTALISACVDNEKPRTGAYTALGVKHTSGQNFWDRNRNRWLNLYKTEVHTLITDDCRAALDHGFDRVLLSNLGFPYLGATDGVNYGDIGDQTPLQAMDVFLTHMERTLGEDAPIDALLFPETAMEGVQEQAGQDAAVFKEAFDRLYVFDGEEPLPAGYIPILSKTDPALPLKSNTAPLGYVLYDENGVYE